MNRPNRQDGCQDKALLADAPILSFKQIEQLSDDEICQRVDAHLRMFKRAFIELGKIMAVLRKRHGKDFQHYSFFTKRLGFKHSSTSDAGKAADVWMHFVDTKYMTERDFEELTFPKCRQLE